MKNSALIMRLRPLILSLLCVFTAMTLLTSKLEAGPFLNIDNIDYTKHPNIQVYLTVRDFNKSVITGLSEENIFLYEDDYLVNYIKIKDLNGSNNLLYLVISIDSSKSISENLLKEIKKTADDLLSNTGQNDMVALNKFNDEVILLNNFTNNNAEIIKNICKIQRHGSKTLFYNALYESLDLLNKTEFPQKAIIVFTDGKDEGSSIEINDVIEFAKESHIPLYCITFNPQDRIKLLSRLTILTGGKLFNSRTKDLSSIYRELLSNIKNKYLVQYKSMLEPDGKPHQIEIKLKYKNISDSDHREIILKRRLPLINLLLDTDYILIVVIILVILLLISVVYSLRKVNRLIKSSVAGKNVSEQVICDNGYYDENINKNNLDETNKKKVKKEPSEEIIETKAWLVERDGPNAGRKIPIQYEETTIGKHKDNRIILDDRSAAGKHAKIKFIKNSFYLFDMASGKGTYLNESKLLRPKLLYDWDEIKIGKKIFIFRISNVA